MRNNIIDSAQKLFRLYGLKKTTMDDIANSLGKTKSAIYYFFTNKEDILQAVAEKEIKQGIDILNNAVNAVEHATEKMAAYIRTRFYTNQSIASFYGFPEEDYFEYHELIKKVRVELDKKELNTITRILTKGNQENIFNVADVELTALNLLNIIRGLEHTYLKKKDYTVLQKEIDNILSILLQGLLKR